MKVTTDLKTKENAWLGVDMVQMNVRRCRCDISRTGQGTHLNEDVNREVQRFKLAPTLSRVLPACRLCTIVSVVIDMAVDVTGGG